MTWSNRPTDVDPSFFSWSPTSGQTQTINVTNQARRGRYLGDVNLDGERQILPDIHAFELAVKQSLAYESRFGLPVTHAETQLRADLNDDGDIDSLDASRFYDIHGYLQADGNLGGTYTLSDFNIVGANYLSGTSLAQGDVTFDGAVNVAELNVIAQVTVGDIGAGSSDPALSLRISSPPTTLASVFGATENTNVTTRPTVSISSVALDPDNDGLITAVETHIGTNPSSPDSDGDLLPDGFELRYGLVPTDSDEDDNGFRDDLDDFDTDGLTNLEEVTAGTDPRDADTDDDGLTDGFESDNDSPTLPDGSLDPNNPDSNDDDVADGDEDPDGDGATNNEEQEGGTDPNDSNSVPTSPFGQWRTYGEATIVGNQLSVGYVKGELDSQSANYHGASVALSPKESYTFSFDFDLKTWDSYAMGGYWDSFSISVTSLPYDTLQLDNDPLSFPFVWGGGSYADGVLEINTDTRTITFSGDGESTMYLNVVLDTSNPPDSDGSYPSWGTFDLPPIANLTAYRPQVTAASYAPFKKTAVA